MVFLGGDGLYEGESGLLCVFGVLEDGFDVDDGGAVDGFEGADFEGGAVDLENGDAVEAERVGAVGAAGGEDAGEGVVLVAAGVDGEGVAF